MAKDTEHHRPLAEDASRSPCRASRRIATSSSRILRDAARARAVDADALDMLEGVLEVADLQVRDIMVPRAQMVFVRRDEPPAQHPADRWSSPATRAFR